MKCAGGTTRRRTAAGQHGGKRFREEGRAAQAVSVTDGCVFVIWDNRCVMHRRDAFSPELRRVMHRTQVKAEAAPA